MTTLVTMQREGRGAAVPGSQGRQFYPLVYKGRAVTFDDRVMVLNAAGNVLFNGSRRLWSRLVSMGYAAGGPPPPGATSPAQG